MLNTCLRILILLLCLNSFGQKFKFKNVSKEELEEKFHPKDSTTSAAVLFEEGTLTMKFDEKWFYELEVVKRIKIYNEDGYDYATIKIPYFYGDNNSSREDIKSLKAYTYNLEGNKVKGEKIKNADIINEQVSEKWKQFKFTFPNLKPGTVIEYTYVYESPNIGELPKWTFQEDIPVNYSKYSHVIPYYFGYKAYSRGYHPIDFDKIVTETSLAFSQSASTDTYGMKTLSTETGTSIVEANMSTYIATDVPKLKDEPFVNNLNNFMTSVKHEMAFSKSGNGQIKEYTTTWQNVSKTLQMSESFGVELDKTNYYQEDIDNALMGAVTEDDKINRILDFVKNRMRWNDYVGIYASEKLKKAYDNRTGSAAQINLMLTSMLRYSGLNANPVLVSTISNGLPLDIASTEIYNYIITAVEKENEIILLDATNKYTAPNLLPNRCLNWKGQLIRRSGSSKEVQLNPSTVSKDVFIMNIEIESEGKIMGQMRRQYTNQLAYQYRVNFSNVNKESYIEKLENDFDISITDYKNSNVEELTKPIIQTIKFEKEDGVDIINNDIYISPLLFLSLDENPFKQDKADRKLPIDFTFPTSKKYVINIGVPEGYTIDYYPEPIAIGLPNNVGSYRFNIKKSSSGGLQISVNKDIKRYILGPEYYQAMKDFYKQIVNKETDKIVLKKL